MASVGHSSRACSTCGGELCSTCSPSGSAASSASSVSRRSGPWPHRGGGPLTAPLEAFHLPSSSFDPTIASAPRAPSPAGAIGSGTMALPRQHLHLASVMYGEAGGPLTTARLRTAWHTLPDGHKRRLAELAQHKRLRRRAQGRLLADLLGGEGRRAAHLQAQ
eukprot:gene3369-3854_t